MTPARTRRAFPRVRGFGGPSSRRRSGRGWVQVLCTLGVALVLSLPPTAARADDLVDSHADPLLVRITGLTPGYIPKRGPITITGTVRNTTAEQWRDINVHALTSTSPMTTREEVAEAAVTDPLTTDTGSRRSDPTTFVTIGDLEAGKETSFTIRLPRSSLHIDGQPGVYWVGVQALGTSIEGRDGLADGRARSFLPLVAAKAKARASLVIPIRQGVRRGADGSLLHARQFADSLGEAGRLGRLTGVLSNAGAFPFSLVIDPAVLDAAQSIVEGNPPLSLGPAAGGPGASPSPSAAPSSDANGGPSALSLDEGTAADARTWLDAVTAAASGNTVLGLPYADADVSALARNHPTLLRLARQLSQNAFADRKIGERPVVAPPSGWLDPASLSNLSTDTVVLLGDHGGAVRRAGRTDRGQSLVRTNTLTTAGGPLPEPRESALAMRQRILSDAALGTLIPDSEPLVAALPGDWDPGASWRAADFFNGLRAPWLRWSGVLGGVPSSTPVVHKLGYPAAQANREISEANMSATDALVGTADVFGDLLDTDGSATDSLHRLLTGAALAASSYDARDDQPQARVQVDTLNQAMHVDLDSVRVAGTPFVTLSGGSGQAAVAIVNDLAQPITVGLRVRTSSDQVQVSAPAPQRIAAGARATVRLNVTTKAIGVHEITLTPVTIDGREFGTPLDFNLRTSQVGRFLYGLMALGGLLLVVMIARRVRTRIKEKKWRRE